MNANIDARSGDRPAEVDLVAGKTVSQVLGEMVWVLTQSGAHKALRLEELEWLVMPAILTKQFQITYVEQTPIKIELWALSDISGAAERIRNGDPQRIQLWTGGKTKQVVISADLRAVTGRA